MCENGRAVRTLTIGRRLRLACFALIAAPAVLLAAPAEAHRGALAPRAPLVAPAAALGGAAAVAPAPADRELVATPVAPPDTRSWVAAPRHTSIPWALVAAAGLGALVGLVRRPRTAVAVALVLLVGVLAFESGVHSVHHLGDPGRASGCVLASTSLNLSGLEVEPVALDGALAPIGPPVSAAAPLHAHARPESPHEGRAPPRLA